MPFPAALDGVVTALSGGSKIGLLLVVAGAGFLLQLTHELVRAAHTQAAVGTAQRIVYALRAKLLGHLQALPAASSRAATAPAIACTAWMPTPTSVNDLIIGGVFPLATSALTLTVMFVILLRLDATLALLSLAVAPFLYICLRYYSKTMTDRAETVKAAGVGAARAARSRSSRRSRRSRASRASATSWIASARSARRRWRRGCG